jgi:transcriptional regulator with XRE-family HTH domain
MPLDAGTIGRRIRLLRTNKGWSQRDLARECGVGLNQILAWEKGRYVAALRRRPLVAKALGVQPDILFFTGEERALMLEETATDVMLSVARRQDASPAQRLSAARALRSGTSAGKAADAAAEFRRLMEKADIDLTALLAELDAQERMGSE